MYQIPITLHNADRIQRTISTGIKQLTILFENKDSKSTAVFYPIKDWGAKTTTDIRTSCLAVSDGLICEGVLVVCYYGRERFRIASRLNAATITKYAIIFDGLVISTGVRGAAPCPL